MDGFIDWFNLVWKVWPNEIDAGERIDANSSAMAASLDRFEALLTGRDHLMGESFGAADCIAFPFLKFAVLAPAADDPDSFHRVLSEHLRPGAGHSRLVDWIRRVDERPRAV